MGYSQLYSAYRNSLSSAQFCWPDAQQLQEASRRISHVEDLGGMLAEFCADLGFDYFSYAIGYVDGDGGRDVPGTQVFSNYPGVWQARYARDSYSNLDPILQYAKRARLPFLWGRDEDLICLTRSSRTLMDECATFGICRGVSIPAHGPGGEYVLFSMCTSGTLENLNDLVGRNFQLLWLVAPLLHRVAAKKLLPRNPIEDAVLSEHERVCLSWTARGKTSWEISRIADRSKATIEYHLQRAMRKLNASTKAQAVAIAVRHGLL